MWFENFYGELVFGNESLLAYGNPSCFTTKRVRNVGQQHAHKHIVTSVADGRMQSTAAKDG